MATSNINVTESWTKLADTSNTELLVSWETPANIEFATTAADVAPTVKGHRLAQNDVITRSVIGSGYVWARLVSGTKPTTVSLVVSK